MLFLHSRNIRKRALCALKKRDIPVVALMMLDIYIGPEQNSTTKIFFF